MPSSKFEGKFSLIRGDDGGPSKDLHQEFQDSQEGSSSSSMVKGKVPSFLDQLSVLPGLRAMYNPDFVYHLEGDLEGIISCMPLLNQS